MRRVILADSKHIPFLLHRTPLPCISNYFDTSNVFYLLVIVFVQRFVRDIYVKYWIKCTWKKIFVSTKLK